MNFRKLLHRVRRLDAWLVPPALLFVIYAELTHSNFAGAIERAIWDKALHFTAYFGLAAMTTIAVRADRRALWWAFGLIAMGGALEILQGFTGRDADIFDELANTLGVFAGACLVWAGIAFLKSQGLVDKTPAP